MGDDRLLRAFAVGRYRGIGHATSRGFNYPLCPVSSPARGAL